MIYGDEPQQLGEYEDPLGTSRYVYTPQITAVMQAGNMYGYGLGNPLRHFDPSGEIAITTIILIGSAVVGLIAAGVEAHQSKKYTGKIDWENTVVTGVSWFFIAASLGLTAYEVYLSYCAYTGQTPVTEVNFDGTAKIYTGNQNLSKGLLSELANSGAKYNPDDVVMITKGADGKLFWLEKGNSSSGLTHILNIHKMDFAAKGVSDIPALIQRALSMQPIQNGMGAAGPYADFLIDGTIYRLAYGTNGYIVSFYPIS